MSKLDWRLIPIFLFFALSFFLWRGLSLDPHHLPSVQVGKALPPFSLPPLEEKQGFFDSENLTHKVTLLNVWASWCQACTDEQAFMMQLAREGVVIYGLNYKDNKEDAKEWLAHWGNPYQLIGQDNQGKVAIDLGVYGAPETFILDKKGIIRYRHVGIMTEEVWLKTIQPLMQELEKQA